MLGEPAAGLDRNVVMTIDHNDAAAFERHQSGVRDRLGGGGEKGRHLRAGALRLLGPAGGLADLDVGDPARGAEFLGDLFEQRRLQGAGHGDGRAGRERLAEPVELGAAELVGGRETAAARLADRARVERRRLLAGTGEHETVGNDGL